MSEFAYIDWLRERTPPAAGVLVGPGDDTAVLRPPTRPQLVTTDMLLDGSCFVLSEAGPRRVGRKAIAVNLSDIAAMAGVPTAAVVSVGLPRAGGRELAEELYLGMREMADAFGVPLVGGDTNSWDGPLAISVTMLGEATDRGPVTITQSPTRAPLRNTGPLGGSIRGHHLDFTPRVREALALHEAADLHAMIDLSDGLAKDLHHICEESRCGAVLSADAIPRNTGCGLAEALGDGEDFELVFTVSPGDGGRLSRDQPIPGLRLHHIGEIVTDGYWLDRDGAR
ncbi:MAG TPA: thiamine-phosphate kinase, partial [Gemmataceae bacterium]|nr:thiamine-phosphate kinase [Gemmataceae bacterium]